MTIIERALDLVTTDSRVGLGSGHASQAFVRALGERIRNGGVPLCLAPNGIPLQRREKYAGIREIATIHDSKNKKIDKDVGILLPRIALIAIFVTNWISLFVSFENLAT